MGKDLAIKGHSTRGKEVIGVLRMMGGRAVDALKGNTDWYVIDECTDNLITIYGYNYINSHNFITFTLEEFLEKYPFKVGDNVLIPEYESEVRICKMRWDPTCQDVEYLVYSNDDEEWYTAMELLKYNDNPTNVSKMKNVLAELLEHIKTTPKEDLEREFEEIKEWSNVGPTVEEFRTFCECVNKKPKYPKLTNLTECKEILGEKDIYQSVSGYKGELLTNFQRLLIFRDAYWKIAGEEMGLNKPWDLTYGCGKWGYWFGYSKNENKIYLQDSRILLNHILVFPTAEMRDAFYENFKDLIEQCKELL